MKYLILISATLFICTSSHAQEFTRQDTLRGSITPERSWWDLQHYHLTVKVDTANKTLSGTNKVTYKVIGQPNRLQIDLQAPMLLHKAVQNGKELTIEHEGSAHFITLKDKQKIDESYDLTLHFSGKPVEAERPPWDGGITWDKDNNSLPFIASVNQGIGSSVWWPNKDHGYDEPDKGILMSIEVPENLMDVSNGRLVKVDYNKKDKTKTYHWEVKNPINNYGVNINIGDYVHFGEKYQGEKGELDMDYYVLRENLSKAKKHFKDAVRTIEAFEHWFGPYPFYEDSYKLVEAPYLGMEHQSSVTYGNGYENGYRGRDLSMTGWGLKFDFIIIHETGHEWFANNITNKDVADMWIHESFTNYSESLFLEYHYSKQAGAEYVRGTRKNIQNASPVIGIYNVNHEGSGDMYYKGANMLHTIRQIVNDDEKWRQILRGLNETFYHQTVTTQQIEDYISQMAGKDLSKIFDQYLRDIRIPIFEYDIVGTDLWCRWSNAVDDFNMPLRINVGKENMWIQPETGWQKFPLGKERVAMTVDRDFYIAVLNVMGK